MSNTIQRNNVHTLGDAGPTLLYAHGFGCNQDMWRRVTPAFQSVSRQILFDYVGCGKSDLTAFDKDRYATLDGYAQDVLDVCDAMDLDSGVTFIGHSVSCSIGMLAAIERPGLFERMVFVGPSPCFLNDPPHYTGGFERRDLEGLLALMDQNFVGWANYFAPVVASEKSPDVSSDLHESFCSTDPVFARVFAEATFFADNRADLPKVACPTLILQHRHDALAAVSVGEYVHQNMPNSEFRVLDVSGHCSHMSHPELVVAEMADFIRLPIAAGG